MVLELLFEQREEAMRKSEYFRRIVEHVDWHFLQHRRTDVDARVEIKHCPKSYVLYGDDREQTEAYHLKLQELINKVTASNRSIRRNYGFIPDGSRMPYNEFLKKGGYIQFDKSVLDVQEIDPAYLTVIPEGMYACCVMEVVDQQADFSFLLWWLGDHGIKPECVVADEIGLQPFEYLDSGYLCEVRVRIG